MIVKRKLYSSYDYKIMDRAIKYYGGDLDNLFAYGSKKDQENAKLIACLTEMKGNLDKSTNTKKNSKFIQDTKGNWFQEVGTNAMSNQGPVNHSDQKFVGFNEKGDKAYYTTK